MVRIARVWWLASILGLVLCSAPGFVPVARAADVLTLFGEENAGTAGAQFLRIPVGARAIALGKAYTSLAADGAALYWNPAGVMRTPGRTNFFASHSQYTAGMNLFCTHCVSMQNIPWLGSAAQIKMIIAIHSHSKIEYI